MPIISGEKDGPADDAGADVPEGIGPPVAPDSSAETGRVLVLRKELPRQPAAPRVRLADRTLIGDSPQLAEVRHLIQLFGPTDASVVITGKSGTGKELVARALHDASPRKNGPFVAINCGAIPEALVESELFGHVRGAFTGAIAGSVGAFERADGGTIFLDEIADMPPGMQVKLLRVLQEKEITQVGAEEVTPVDFRVVAATNADLIRAVEEGRFREDLFYRINVLGIEMPSLSERPGDIQILARYLLLREIADESGGEERCPPVLRRDAEQMLIRYPWPGNVRELQSFIKRLAIHFGSATVITAENISEVMTERQRELCAAAVQKQLETMGDSDIPDDGIDFNVKVKQFETALITAALIKTINNRTRTAMLLRLNRTDLVEKMKKHRLSDGRTLMDAFPTSKQNRVLKRRTPAVAESGNDDDADVDVVPMTGTGGV